MDLLEEVLDAYQGTLLLVSHDRDFLDRLATGIIAFEAPGRVGEYAGGYSDYRRQSRQAGEPSGKTKATPKQAAKAKASPARGTSKLSYKDQRELDNLPAEIDALTAEIATLDQKLSASDFYQRDPTGFQAVVDRLAICRSTLERSEERWLELEDMKERLREEARS